MELNNTIAKPLYKQLEDQLKEEIDIGKRKAGSRLPTENELSTTYNVSRVTGRKKNPAKYLKRCYRIF